MLLSSFASSVLFLRESTDPKDRIYFASGSVKASGSILKRLFFSFSNLLFNEVGLRLGKIHHLPGFLCAVNKCRL